MCNANLLCYLSAPPFPLICCWRPSRRASQTGRWARSSGHPRQTRAPWDWGTTFIPGSNRSGHVTTSTITHLLWKKDSCTTGINCSVFQIDTLAAEYPAVTNYLYCTYHGQVRHCANQKMSRHSVVTTFIIAKHYFSVDAYFPQYNRQRSIENCISVPRISYPIWRLIVLELNSEWPSVIMGCDVR